MGLDSVDATETGTAQPANESGLPPRGLGLLWVHPRTGVTELKDGAILGREPQSSAVLEGAQVSRHHASVHQRSGAYFIADSRSRNGTFVDGKRVEQAPLVVGSTLRIGEWVAVVSELPAALDPETPFWQPQPGFVVGPKSRDQWRQIELLAPSMQPILIEGPTGAGKEVVARAIHQRSGRSGPYVAVNCAALPESLVEAQLFGHTKGAFTGAVQATIGLVASADGGTLLLDEVADLSLSHQAKLLRAIEERNVLRVGETVPRPVNVRYLAACQRSLWQLSREGLFRADLLGRLAGGRVRLLPLRQRREEIPALFRHYFAEAGGDPASLTATAVEVLCMAPWPLNVRQVVQSARLAAVTFAGESSIAGPALRETLAQVCADEEPSALSEEARESSVPAPPAGRRGVWLKAHRESLERLLGALAQCDGNISEAARVVDLPRWRATRLLAAHEEAKNKR